MADPTDRTSMDDLRSALAKALDGWCCGCDTFDCQDCRRVGPDRAATALGRIKAVLRERGLLLGPDGLLRAEEVARMGWEPYDEAEDVPCPQWVGPYDTLVDGQSLVALSPLDPPEDT